MLKAHLKSLVMLLTVDNLFKRFELSLALLKLYKKGQTLEFIFWGLDLPVRGNYIPENYAQKNLKLDAEKFKMIQNYLF